MWLCVYIWFVQAFNRVRACSGIPRQGACSGIPRQGFVFHAGVVGYHMGHMSDNSCQMCPELEYVALR